MEGGEGVVSWGRELVGPVLVRICCCRLECFFFLPFVFYEIWEMGIDAEDAIKQLQALVDTGELLLMVFFFFSI